MSKHVDHVREHPPIILLMRETPWNYRSRSPHIRTGNRFTLLRMRDARRWVYNYRVMAEERALSEAKNRSFLHRLMYVMMATTSMLSDERKRLR